MKDEEEFENIPDGEEPQEASADENAEGFDEVIRPASGSHFYENDENPDDTITKVTGMYKDWFLDYASYVILERAVPAVEDGLKPVQRRILHAMKERNTKSSAVEMQNGILEFEKEWGIGRQKDLVGGIQDPKPFRLQQGNDFEIFLMQRKDQSLGKNLGKTTGWIHRAALKSAGVHMLSGVQYQKISEQGFVIQHQGHEKLLAVDQIIICAGQESLNVLSKELQDLSTQNQSSSSPEVHVIGGARVALELDAKAAIRDGFEVGSRI
mgnify:CR=1 FL=1